MIVSSTEPPELRAIASTVSTYPERFGVDIFFTRPNPDDESVPWKVGVQRKYYTDLIASVNDGRLVKELMQMSALDYKYLILEGEVKWTDDGQMILESRYGNSWSVAQWNGLLWSIQDRGVSLLYTKDISDTISTVQMLERWFAKSSHTSLSIRPALKGMWGEKATHEQFASWMLMGIPGVGPKVSEAIVKMYGLPLELTVGVEELMKVPGVGKGKAEMIVRVFEDDDS